MNIPHRCPKCDGKGWLQYDPVAPFAVFHTTFAGPWQCPPCGGTGILWCLAPDPQPAAPLPQYWPAIPQPTIIPAEQPCPNRWDVTFGPGLVPGY